MNGDPTESSLLRAAAKNIQDLQRAVADLQRSADEAKGDAATAKSAATEAKEEATRWKLLTRALGVVVLVALVASALSIYNWTQAADATDQLRTQAIMSCEQSNQRAAGIVTALDELVTILEGPKPTPEILAAGSKYKAFVLNNNAPRDCTQAYSAVQAYKEN